MDDEKIDKLLEYIKPVNSFENTNHPLPPDYSNLENWAAYPGKDGQQFYLPDGQSTQRKGVTADIVLPSISAKMDVAEGDLQYALEHDVVAGAKHSVYNMVPLDLLDELRVQSEKRVTANEEFTDLLRRISSYVAQKEEDSVPLNESAFVARRQE